jgi:hypothetical protein
MIGMMKRVCRNRIVLKAADKFFIAHKTTLAVAPPSRRLSGRRPRPPLYRRYTLVPSTKHQSPTPASNPAFNACVQNVEERRFSAA